MSEAAPEIREDIEESPEITQGPLYRVIIHNDEVTPMDFVIYVLRQIFLLTGPYAVQVMYSAHYHGNALVDILPKSEAQQRVHQAHYAARLAGYPLQFTLERE
jgi:ATP-dependent Clp protease adaptor protein ClpS